MQGRYLQFISSLIITYVPLLTLIIASLTDLAASVHEAATTRKLPEGPSNFTFYLHNIVYSPALNNSNFTSVYSAGPVNFSLPNPYNFGVRATFEDPLTLGPDRTSAKIGVAQGIWVLSSQAGFDLHQTFTATFDNGPYTGTLSISGQIKEVLQERIMAVIGGTGDFLGARGAAVSKLVTLDSHPPATWTLSFDLDLYY